MSRQLTYQLPACLKNDKAEICYFCDIIPERAEAAVGKYGCGKAVTDYHEILNDAEIDAVSACTPNNVHAPIAIDFMKAGKHVLCEKPAARIYPEALEMQKVQHETGMTLNKENYGIIAIKKHGQNMTVLFCILNLKNHCFSVV